MNLNSKLNSNFSFKKIVLIILVVLLCVLVGIGFYLGTRNIDEPVEEVPDRTLVPDNNPVKEEIPKEVEQTEAISKLTAKILKKRDLSTRMEFDIEVGVGENKTTSIVKATSSTTFFDLGSLRVINPSDVQVEDTIILYATGKYNVGNLSAEVIAIGEDTSYSFDRVISVNSNGEDSYIWVLKNSIDRLYVDKNTVITNGYTGEGIYDSNILKVGEKVLFKGTIEVTDKGNIIHCTEIITLGL